MRAADREEVSIVPLEAEDEREAVTVVSQMHKPPQSFAERYRSLLGLSLMAGAAFFISIQSLAAKIVSADIQPFQLVFLRSAVQTVLTFAVLFKMNLHPFGEAKRGWCAVRGFLGFASSACFYYSLVYLSLGEVVSLSFSNPVFTAMLAEKWEYVDILGALLCLAGVCLIARPSFLFGSAGVAGEHEIRRLTLVGIALLGAVFSALAYITIRKVGTSVHAMVLVNYTCFVPLILAPWGMVVMGQYWVWPTPSQWFPVIIVGVTAFIAQIMLNRGLQIEKAAKASTMNYLQIVFAFLFQLTFLNQPAYWMDVVGSILIGGWILVVMYKEYKKRNAE